MSVGADWYGDVGAHGDICCGVEVVSRVMFREVLHVSAYETGSNQTHKAADSRKDPWIRKLISLDWLLFDDRIIEEPDVARDALILQPATQVPTDLVAECSCIT